MSSPIQPPNLDISGRLIGLAQLAQQRQDRQQQMALDRFDSLLRVVQADPDANLEPFADVLGAMPNELRAAEEARKGVKRRQKRERALTGLESNENIASLASGLARTPSPGGGFQQTLTGSGLRGVIEPALSAGVEGPEIARVLNLARARSEALNAGVQEGLASEERAERRVIASEGRGERRAARERRDAAAIQADKQFVEASAVRIADATARGEEPSAVISDIESRFGPEAPKRIAEALNLAASERIKASTPTGEEATRKERIESAMRLYGMSRDEAVQFESGKGFIDPATARFLPGSPTSQFAQQRAAVASLSDLSTQLNSAAEAIAEEARVFPGVATVEALKRRVGAENPAIARYELLRQNFVATLVKQRSGAQVNELELELYFSMPPSLEQLTLVNGQLSEGARARLDTLSQIVENERQSPIRNLRNRAAAPEATNPADIRLGEAAQRFADGEITQGEFDRERDRWLERRGEVYRRRTQKKSPPARTGRSVLNRRIQELNP